MPSTMRCPDCDRVGFVRQEHVIRGGFATAAYDCGHCGYAWTVIEESRSDKARREVVKGADRSERLR